MIYFTKGHTIKFKLLNVVHAMINILDNLIMILTLGNVISYFTIPFIKWKLKQK